MLSVRFTKLFPAAACTLFLLTGAAFVPRLGIQNDEALFAGALLPPRAEEYKLHLGRYQVPLMLMPYVGTVKAFLYRPMIRAFGTGVWATRLPMLLAAAASIWIFYLLMLRVAGDRAAVISTGLLSVDSMYLLSAGFDWGPVALQHLLLVGGMLLLVRFWQERRELALAGGFFLFGLAIWDKAVVVWILSGMGIAALSIYPREIFSVVTLRRTGLAALAFVAGALPLIVYNVNVPGGTFHDTTTFETSNIAHKIVILRKTINGSALFGTLTSDDFDPPQIHPPKTLLERASASVAKLTGYPTANWIPFTLGLALLLSPLSGAPGLRVTVFSVLAMAIAWVQMAVTANAGTSVHHTILLWPFPYVILGVSSATASRRLGRAAPALAVLLILVAGSALAVTNEYYALLVRNGGAVDWTDAIFPLSGYLAREKHSAVYAMDWSIADNLRLLNRGRLPLFFAMDPVLKKEWTEEDRSTMLHMISDPDHVFVSHPSDKEFFKGLSARLVEWAGSQGYRREEVTAISDSYGRPTFEVYRFVKPQVDVPR